jgi:hypothetical protein
VPAAVVHPTARSSAPSFAKTGAVVAVAVGCACIETAGQYMLAQKLGSLLAVAPPGILKGGSLD